MPTWFDANGDERAALFKTLDAAKAIIEAIIEKDHRPDGYNIGINCGPAAGR